MASNPDRLGPALRASLARYGPPADRVEAVVDDLRRRHREPHRHHHTLEHVGDVLDAIDRLADLAGDPALVRLAACYHDAMYDPRSSTNEHDSAELAARQLGELGVAVPDVAAVARLIAATAGHEPTDDPDEAVLVDADLWILGAPPERYRRYARAVRREYAHVDDDAWRAGRATVLDAFLARPRLYATDRFHAELDAQARANLRTERATLG